MLSQFATNVSEISTKLHFDQQKTQLLTINSVYWLPPNLCFRLSILEVESTLGKFT